MEEKQIALRNQALELSVDDIKGQVNLIQQVMREVMQEGHHYGVIPGTDKPTLLKPGAEKLGLTFRLAPEFIEQVIDLGNDHREYRYKCSLRHIVTGVIVGEGVGSCTTKETKYRYRLANRTCPVCGVEAIIKGKEEYGGGWLCFKKKGGCGAKWQDGDPTIESQEVGRIENPDIADVYNTVQKMGKKRAHIDAMLTATAASDSFTQDLEDVAEVVVKDVTPADDDMRAVVTRYLDDARLDNRLTVKQHQAALFYVGGLKDSALSEAAAAYAEKLGDDTPLVVGDSETTGPTDEIADKAFTDDDEQLGIF